MSTHGIASARQAARRARSPALIGLIGLIGLPGLAGFGSADAADRPPVTVFAAASLTDAMGEVAAAYTAATGTPVRTSFAASSALARQIESGAPADVFFSADLAWMDELEAHGLLRAGSRRNALTNRLVLVAPADAPAAAGGDARTPVIGPHFALAAALGRGRLATGDPDSVPVGRYAREALEHLGLWRDVADRLARAENVRSALAFVDRGEAPLGIVYATDARIDPRIRVIGVFPDGSHAPIVYPIAATARSGPEAQRLLEFVGSPAAAAIFRRFGFALPGEAPGGDAASGPAATHD